MKLLSVLVLLVQCIAVFSQWGTRCVTPNGDTSVCIPLDQCSPLHQAAEAVLMFLEQSQCGHGNNSTMVCCSIGGIPAWNNNGNNMRTTKRKNAGNSVRTTKRMNQKDMRKHLEDLAKIVLQKRVWGY